MPDPTIHSLPTGTATFLFTDIEGSTRLLASLGDAYDPLLASHASVLRECFSGHGWVEVNTEGDAFFVVFPSATEAVGAAVDAQRADLTEAQHACEWELGRGMTIDEAVDFALAVVSRGVPAA